MSAAADHAQHRRLPAVLTQGFRPFFLAAGLWAAAALIIWIVMLTNTVPPEAARSIALSS